MKRLNWLVLMGALTVACAGEGAKAADVDDVNFVDGTYGGWSCYVGQSAYAGQYAGEWTASVDGRPAVGYFASQAATE